MKLAFLIFLLSILSGCASVPRSAVQTSSGAEVTLSRPDDRMYLLVNESGRIVSRAYGDTATLRFDLPTEASAGQCFQIVRDDGRNIFSDQRFSLPLAARYREFGEASQQSEAQARRWRADADRARQRRAQSNQQLRANRAYNGSTCALPSPRNLPPIPDTRCTSEAECTEEGAAICFTRFLGLEGCSLALKEVNVSSFLANPSCAAVAAQLAGEKYEMDDAFVDFIHGVVDDVADELIQSDSLLDQIIATGIKAASLGVKLNNARTCTQNFVQTYYGPRRTWAAEVERIRAEPASLLRDCQSSQSAIATADRDERAALDAERIALQQKSEHERQMALLREQRMGLPACGR